ncbi:MAG: homoserine kinase, partial [Chloroherpetonaceae bacterium]|nr:homoserine kinase [Chloroherpetonaceae bacterium]
MTEVTAFAPATVANVGAGFDVLGFALCEPGDELTARFSDGEGVAISRIEGDGGRLPLDARKNTAGVSAQALLKRLGERRGIELELRKKMPLGSGLGSSAASAVAAVVAVNELLGRPLSKRDLLPFALEGERVACGSAHADNAAPSLLGGFALVRSYAPLDVISLPSPPSLFATVVHPHIEIQTKDARAVLKQQISLSNAITQWGNVAGLVAGLLMSDYALISRSLQDVIVEPIRAILIPRFYEMKKAALDAGALGCSISGSGPSLFALSDSAQTAQDVANAMRLVLDNIGIGSDAFVSKINSEGAKV